jgi:hypothetical protein
MNLVIFAQQVLVQTSNSEFHLDQGLSNCGMRAASGMPATLDLYTDIVRNKPTLIFGE